MTGLSAGEFCSGVKRENVPFIACYRGAFSSPDSASHFSSSGWGKCTVPNCNITVQWNSVRPNHIQFFLALTPSSTDPKTPAQLRLQFQTFCRGLGLNPEDPNILNTLRDPKKVSWQSITKVIETESLGQYGTFRGCLSSDWIITSPGPMARQRSGAFTSSLKEHGVEGVVVGELTEEWYLYSIAHPISSPHDILPNLNRYFPDDISKNLLAKFGELGEDASEEEAIKLAGEVLSAGQVYLPVRLFVRDLVNNGYPTVRYQIRWTPEEVRPFGMYHF